MSSSCPRIISKIPRWLLILAAIVACIAFLVLIVLPAARKTDYGRSYVVMVDAGSSSSKVYVYSWASAASTKNTPAEIKQEFFQRTKSHGISYFADSPISAPAEIVEILKQKVLKDSRAIIPADQRASTPIYLAATAGMRLLDARNPVASKMVMDSMRTEFSKLGLLVTNATRQMRIISGDEEALAGWISTNYLSHTLQRTADDRRKPQEGTIGALDMGGASAQISFVTTEPVGLEVSEVNLYSHKFKVYQHSFLCFGKAEARLQLYYHLWKAAGFPKSSIALKNPCGHTSHLTTVTAEDFLQKPCFINAMDDLPNLNESVSIEGTGDPGKCRELIKLLFQRKNCSYKRCSFEGIFQPEPPAGKFVGFSSYYFAMHFFNVTKYHPSRSTFREILKRFCQRSWDSAVNQYSDMVPITFLSGYCFDGIYIDEILSHLGFKDDRWSDLSFVGKIGDRKMSWPLGFILKESASVPSGIMTYSIPQSTYVGLMTLFVIIFILAIVLIVIYSLSRWIGHRYTQASTEQPHKV